MLVNERSGTEYGRESTIYRVEEVTKCRSVEVGKLVEDEREHIVYLCEKIPPTSVF